MSYRHARCLCGQLSVTLGGDPFVVLLCNCTDCQRRSGSIYGVGAYFAGAQAVATAGTARRYTKTAQSGRLVQFHFCPDCGTSLYWTAPDAPLSEGLGVAVGCFNDRSFPRPDLIAWCDSALAWATFPDGVERQATQPDRLPRRRD
jgi:hypothetical protein